MNPEFGNRKASVTREGFLKRIALSATDDQRELAGLLLLRGFSELCSDFRSRLLGRCYSMSTIYGRLRKVAWAPWCMLRGRFRSLPLELDEVNLEKAVGT